MLAFAGIERDRCGLGPFPTWALIKRYGDTPRSFSYAQLNHRQLYIRGESYQASWVSLQVAARTDLYASLPHPKRAFPLADR
jgi:hypothetical protein